MFNRGCLGRREGPFESTLFLNICQMAQKHSPAFMTNSRHHNKLFEFLTILAFSEVFSVENGRYGVGIPSSHIWLPHMSVSGRCKKLRSFIHSPKTTTSWQECARLSQTGPNLNVSVIWIFCQYQST